MRFFKLVEILEQEYFEKTDDEDYDLHSQSVLPVNNVIYVACDTERDLEISAELLEDICRVEQETESEVDTEQEFNLEYKELEENENE